MHIKLIGFILFICAVSIVNLFANDTITLHVNRNKLQFPVVSVDHENVVATPVLYPIEPENGHQDQTKPRYHYKLELSHLLPRDRYLYDSRKCYLSTLLVHLTPQGSSYELKSSSSQSDDGFVNPVFSLKKGRPNEVFLCFSTPCSDDPLCLDLQIEIENEKSMGLKITNLLSYKLQHEFESKQVDLRLLCNYWEINLLIKDLI